VTLVALIVERFGGRVARVVITRDVSSPLAYLGVHRDPSSPLCTRVEPARSNR
jgi:hypothetical protein